MAHLRETSRERARSTCGLAVVMLAALLLSTSAAHGGLTSGACLAKKVKEWGKLQKCHTLENAKALQGKAADLEKCQTKFEAKLASLNAQAAVAGVACRYRLNGDFTLTDVDTGLMWEQKTDDGGIHDKDNLYNWNTVLSGVPPNGTAFTDFLGTLNGGTSDDGTTTSGCFAGHCDWRLPTIEELQTILDTSEGTCGGGGGPCIDPVFGPTAAGLALYWSSTSLSSFLGDAWVVDFGSGSWGNEFKVFNHRNYVRAVRRTLSAQPAPTTCVTLGSPCGGCGGGICLQGVDSTLACCGSVSSQACAEHATCGGGSCVASGEGNTCCAACE